MKRFCVAVLTVLLLLTSCTKETQDNEITVYCYDSFVGEYEPGEKLAEDFEAETGIHVNLVSCAGAVQLYSKLLFEGDICEADAVIGLPDSIKIDESLFLEWIPSCKNDLIEYDGNTLIPFDYGTYAFVYNTECSDFSPPDSLKSLEDNSYKDKLIIVDPRTSAVGLGLLRWSYSCLDTPECWWKNVLDNALTVTDSWSSAYGLFLEGEAPLVISYSTSPVYHMMNDNSVKYIALNFEEGHIQTKEYLAVLGKSAKQEQAKRFCEYVLTKGQKDIAVSNTMFPANTKTELPEEYKSLINPEIIHSDMNMESLVEKWEEIVVQ